MCECLRIKWTYFSRHSDHSASFWFNWRLHYHRHKNTVKIIILNNLPFSNLNDSNKQQCWYMIKSSKKPFLLHLIWSCDQRSSYEKVKGRWFELRCGHYKLCIVSSDRLSIYIVNVYQAAIRYQITLVGGYLVGVGGELVFHPEKGGGVKAPHTYILLYFL